MSEVPVATNVPTTANHNNNDNPILTALSQDFWKRVGNNATEEHISLNRCLRKVFISKQRPSKVVKLLLEQATSSNDSIITGQHFKSAHVHLLEACNSTNNSDDTTTTSCLVQIGKMTQVVGFVQLLLEWKPSNETISEADCNQMIISLLSALSKNVCFILKQTTPAASQHDDDYVIPTDRMDGCILASFVLVALLRAVNPYAAQKPLLLSPLLKGMTSIIQQHSNLPPELSKETLLALMVYLKQGEAQCTASLAALDDDDRKMDAAMQQQQLFHIKVLNFLLGRLAILMPIYWKQAKATMRSDQAENDDDMDAVWTCMTRIRGLALASSRQAPSILPHYQQLGQKVESCLAKLLTSSGGGLDSVVVNKLRNVRCGSAHSDSFASTAASIGKLLILKQVLESSLGGNETSSETPLLVCQDLLLLVIPRCYHHLSNGSSALNSCLQQIKVCISKTMLQAEHQVLTGADCCFSRIQLHCLFLRWLAPPEGCNQVHPLSFEFIVLVVAHHVVDLAHVRGSHSGSPRSVEETPGADHAVLAKPLVAMMTKLLFDPRTSTAHRQNIASVLIRILRPDDAGSSAGAAKLVSECIINEFAASVKKDSSRKKKKRKRKETSASSAAFSFNMCSASDCQTLAALMQNVPSIRGHPFLKEKLVSLQGSLETASDNCGFRIGDCGPMQVAPLLWLLSGIMGRQAMDNTDEGPSASNESIEDLIGCSVLDLILSLCKWYRKAVESRQKGTFTKGAFVAAWSTLSLVGTALGTKGTPVEIFNPVVDVLTCTSKMLEKLMLQDKEKAAVIFFQVATILGKIGSIVSPISPAALVQKIAATFKSLFCLQVWSLSAWTMSALEKFASTLPACHQGILPKCLPAESQGLLQARLQGIVYRDRDSHKDSAAVHRNYASRLRVLIPTSQMNDRLFSTTTHNILLANSYFCAMPTVEGRSAWVFFPPGDQSLNDIQFMLGEDMSLEEGNVQRLKRVRLAGDGGCQLFSESYRSS